MDVFCETDRIQRRAVARGCSTLRSDLDCRSRCMPSNSAAPGHAHGGTATARSRAITSSTRPPKMPQALAAAGSVAVLLPIAFYCLADSRKPPVAGPARRGRDMAVATDCNPGSAPGTSLLLAMSMATRLFGLTARGSARRRDSSMPPAPWACTAMRGELAVGQAADFVIWNVQLHRRAGLLDRIQSAPHRGARRGGAAMTELSRCNSARGRSPCRQLRRVYTDPMHGGIGEPALRAVERVARGYRRTSQPAMRPLTASTPASASWRRRAFPTSQRALLQRNILLSHSAGVGPLLDDGIVRLVMVLKLASLLRGFSGVSTRAGALPRAADQRGPATRASRRRARSAPPAISRRWRICRCRCWDSDDSPPRRDPPGRAKRWRRKASMPLELGPKEGLALLNGTQVSTALALAALFELEELFAAAVVSGTMSLDALQGSDVPFDPRIHELRGHAGQTRVAAGATARCSPGARSASRIAPASRVQDPYSLRCQPQVMGACLDLMPQAAATLLTEANAVTDNPLIFAGTDEVLSGGNFHAEPVAFAADILALACAEIGSIAERRIALLVDPKMSGLPAVPRARQRRQLGLHDGAGHRRRAGRGEPHAVPSGQHRQHPTSANQEDHVSMATHGARRLLAMTPNLLNVIAIELLAACQGIDFRRPLKTSPRFGRRMRLCALRCPFAAQDRLLAADIEAAAAGGAYARPCSRSPGSCYRVLSGVSAGGARSHRVARSPELRP